MLILYFQSVALHSIEHPRMDVRSVDRRVASRRPAGAHSHHRGVVHLADIQLTAAYALVLCVATEAKIRVRRDEHLVIDRAVRVVTGRAGFAHRLVLEHKRPRLLAMTLAAGFIEPRHREAAGGFHDVA